MSEYVGRRFSDHQQAVAIRAGIVDGLSRPSVRIYSRALDVVSAAVTRESETDLRRQRNRVVNAWFEASADIDAKVVVHFEHQPVKDDWHAYQHAVYELVALSHATGNAQAAAHASHIRDFLERYAPSIDPRDPAADPRGSRFDPRDPRWTVIRCTEPHCRARLGWYTAYSWLGDQVLDRRLTIMLGFLDAKVENFG